ncbi:MAG: hypothetical protein CMN28_13445 [Salinisphaeraceae bacterium]|nr:hypothetical protein [Salinisphaeraceae bacterium]
MESLLKQKPIDCYGAPIPWMNLTVVALLKARLTRDLTMFEYGSGYSTHFFAARVKSIKSVEYDRHWQQLIGKDFPANGELIYIPQDVDGKYCRAVGGGNYDVIVIDGRDRVNCMKQSLSALSPGGVIIFDDSHRTEYQGAFEDARAHGFKVMDIEGLKATGGTSYTTSLIYREQNCLGL